MKIRGYNLCVSSHNSKFEKQILDFHKPSVVSLFVGARKVKQQKGFATVQQEQFLHQTGTVVYKEFSTTRAYRFEGESLYDQMSLLFTQPRAEEINFNLHENVDQLNNRDAPEPSTVVPQPRPPWHLIYPSRPPIRYFYNGESDSSTSS